MLASSAHVLTPCGCEVSRAGYVDKRGNWRSRQRRRAWLLATFDSDLGPLRARCRLKLHRDCRVIVDSDTLSVDRKEIGGTYARHNIQPACKPCQDRQGYLLGAGSLIEPLLQEYRDARHAWEQLFEAETQRTYVPGIIERELRKSRRGGRNEVSDFVEQHPPPMLRYWLEQLPRTMQDQLSDASSARAV